MSDNGFLACRFPGTKEIRILQGVFKETSPDTYIPVEGDFVVRPFEGKSIYILQESAPAEWEDFVISNSAPPMEFPDELAHKEIVAKAIQDIEREKYHKVVLSRAETQPLKSPPNLKSMFLALEKNYPDAFICLLISEKWGCWLGASPEPLLNQFEIAALAGSVEENAVWTEKEIEEHRLVSEYISGVLTNAQVEFETSELLEKPMGHIKHLLRKFQIDVSISLQKQLKLAEQLHPTPAVCGLPVEEAFQSIKDYEAYDRELYTGYWGMVSEKGVRLFVNLRVCKIWNNRIDFYAGGGINKLSDTEKELQETKYKVELLRKYIL